MDSAMIIVDAIWVRKWKRYPDGSIRVKSRLCARGCFDEQKSELATRSTTATRLSQRMVLSISARKNYEVESLDIAGAFLKGFTFDDIKKTLQPRGLHALTRRVVVLPRMNVWRHFNEMKAENLQVPEHALHLYGLLAIKPVYGLNDAPLAWQFALHDFVHECGGRPSKMDENMHMFKSDKPDESGDSITPSAHQPCG